MFHQGRAAEHEAELVAGILEGHAAPTGFGNQGLGGRGIPGVELEVQHGVDASPQYLGVSEGVRVTAQHGNLTNQGIEGGLFPALAETIDVAVGDERAREIGLFGNPHRLSVAVTAASGPAHIAFAQRRQVDQADHRDAVDHQSDQRREERNSPGESDGSIDGVDDPTRRVGIANRAVFFAENRKIRMTLGQDLANGAFGGAVRFGDRGPVCLVLHRDGAESAEDLSARGIGGQSGALRRGFQKFGFHDCGDYQSVEVVVPRARGPADGILSGMEAPTGKSLLERLGFAAEDRVAVVHCDDIGMCHAANEGAFEALANGPATCGSIMVPCPWFPEAATYARAHPELDLGVHLTLTSEWKHYRWGPVAGSRAVPSLLDDTGYFPGSLVECVQRAKAEEAEVELRAQIDRALDAGIDVTHLDSHMGTCFIPPLLDVYARLACDYRLPVLATLPDAETLRAAGMQGLGESVARAVAQLEANGIPALDGLDANSLHFEPGAGEAHNRNRLSKLRPGVNYLICHPARGGEELSSIAPDAHMRDFERTFYGGETGRTALAREGIQTVGMRPLRDLVRQST